MQADAFKQAALSLKQNPAIISTLLRDQNDIPLATLEYDIVLGNPQSFFHDHAGDQSGMRSV